MPQGEPVSREEAVRTAWQVHAALGEWTRSVDAKASFALAMESAALAGVAALSGSGRRLSTVSGPAAEICLWAGVLLLGLSAALAVLVVLPRHTRAGRSAPGPGHFIFYGHLRHWTPEQLTEQLTRHDPLPALTHQLVAMSEILWTKQRRVQQSLACALSGGALVAVVGAFG
ncbi:Pycsar system effector family protein [Streptomyces sp. NPDC020681]|uniref:Pycsar system effector family protein n=1 Tax=Streptomyces sp. NPDC020681 TaxID=3365083 RepID=UPI003790D1EA